MSEDLNNFLKLKDFESSEKLPSIFSNRKKETVRLVYSLSHYAKIYLNDFKQIQSNEKGYVEMYVHTYNEYTGDLKNRGFVRAYADTKERIPRDITPKSYLTNDESDTFLNIYNVCKKYLTPSSLRFIKGS